MPVVNMHEAKTHLAELVRRVQQGETFIIARAGQPLAHLTALRWTPPPRRLPVGDPRPGRDRGPGPGPVPAPVPGPMPGPRPRPQPGHGPRPVPPPPRTHAPAPLSADARRRAMNE